MTTVLINYAPRRYFTPFHDREQRFACIVAHRRAGKTTACIHDLQRAVTRVTQPRPRLGYIAPLLKQAKAVAWDILKAAATPLIRHGVSINESELRIDYPNEGQIRLYGADNPDALRGIYLDACVLDEPAQIDPRLWPEVLRPALTDRQGSAIFIGTPKGRDAFYQVWRDAQKDTAGWYTIKLPASRTKIIPESELAAARAVMSPAQYAREFECSFDEPDVAQFIDSETVDAARSRIGAATGPKVLGVDVARHGDDRTVVILRNGDLIEDDWITIWRGADLMQTAGRVAEIITRDKPRQVFIDGVGVGGGVVDRLRQLGFPCVDVNAGGKATSDDRFTNSRAEMWSRMRDWLRDKGSIPSRDDIADDLTAPLYEFDHRNRLKLERKEDMKSRGLASPDIADALALTFARRVAVDDRMPSVMWKRDAAAPEADPLANW